MVKTQKTRNKIKPALVLLDIRKAVSDILNKPFSEKTDHRVFKPDQKILALWAAECAEHVLPFFEEKYPAMTGPGKLSGHAGIG